ncbi:putative Transmembrane protein [Melia azedarach]|uniref:Transmembrane protein n=1 Tax=Melia azedarach TaxID=155640 RepID=A0ACC1YZ84_MELAZ|nr:putative Transmembrane protein [Melia azedarach]
MEEKESEDKLDQLYSNLEDEWDGYIKQSKPRNPRRCSTGSSIVGKTLSLLENSPRTLMSSLQHRRSPAADREMSWKVRTNDLAVMEILRERRAAIESGKLKGRRLFDDIDIGFGGTEEIYTASASVSGWNINGLIQDCEVRSMTSYDSDDEEGIGASEVELPVCSQFHSRSSSSCTSLCNEVVLKEGEVLVEVEDKRSVSSGGWKRVLVWLAVALIIGAVCITSVGRSFSGYRNEDHKVILVPT